MAAIFALFFCSGGLVTAREKPLAFRYAAQAVFREPEGVRWNFIRSDVEARESGEWIVRLLFYCLALIFFSRPQVLERLVMTGCAMTSVASCCFSPRGLSPPLPGNN